MRLLLIRHGETVDNVAGKYAGTTDSALTNHGVIQANRLGSHLAQALKVSHIFSSDLQRAVKTAEAIRLAQDQSSTVPHVTKLKVLREQDFGFYEGKVFHERSRDSNQHDRDAHLERHRNDPGFKDVESKEAMESRMDTFVDEYLLEFFGTAETGHNVVVVAHGIILSHLWRSVLRRFASHDVSVETGVVAPDNMFNLEHLGVWSNTGYLDLVIKPKTYKEAVAAATLVEQVGGANKEPSVEDSLLVKISSASSNTAAEIILPPTTSTSIAGPSTEFAPPGFPSSKLQNLSLVVKAVNSLEHLKGLKKTRGGIGSLKHDSNQKTMDSFFSKKRKFESS